MKRALRLALALLLPSLAFANDTGVVVFSNSVVVQKEVYAGPPAGPAGYWAGRQAVDPTLTFTVFALPDPAFDAVVAPINQPQYRADAASFLNTDFTGLPKLIRAVLLVILDEVNLIRAQLGLGARTAAQFKNAVANKLTTGNAD